MDGGTLIWGALLILGAIGVGGLATGRWHLEMVRDATDAKLARWMIGAVVLVGAIVVVLIQPVPAIRLPAIALGVSGAWMIATAARFAPSDRTVGIVERAITESARALSRNAVSRTRSRLDVQIAGPWFVLSVVFVVGASVMIVLLPLHLASRPQLDAWAVVAITLVAWLFLVALMIPVAWLALRRIRGIPFFRIDEWGVVMGVDRARDRYVNWPDVVSVDVSVRTGGGVTDHVIRFATTGPTSAHPSSLKWRIVDAVSMGLYGEAFAISTLGLTASTEQILALIAVHRPDALAVTTGPDPDR